MLCSGGLLLHLAAMNLRVQYVICLILLVLCVVGYVRQQTVLGFDDAYISYRYAQNLAAGHGPVFNPGERVEGYTNPLYVAVVTPAFFFLPDDAVYFYSVVLSTIFLALSLGILFVIARENRLGKEAIWAGLIFAASPMLWYAVWSGMETCLVLFGFSLLWWGVSRTENDERSSVVPLVVGSIIVVLTRADGFVMCGVVIAYLMLKQRWRPFFILSGSTAVTLGAITVWRLMYYGYPLPNTYYVKVSGELSQRIVYAITSLWYQMGFMHLYLGVLLFGFVVGAFVVVINQRSPLRLMRFEFFFPPVWLAYWIYVGGDIFKERFLLPFILLAAYAVVAYVGARRLRWVAALAVIAFPLYTVPYLYATQYVDLWAEMGKYLREHHAGRTLAIDGAGKAPFYSGLYTIDTMGLNDLVIAHGEAQEQFAPGHNKTNLEYVLERKPDLWGNWVAFGSKDLSIGLDEETYTAHGYRLTHLFYAGEYDPDAEIAVDVVGADRDEIRDLFIQGYSYGMLTREP